MGFGQLCRGSRHKHTLSCFLFVESVTLQSMLRRPHVFSFVFAFCCVLGINISANFSVKAMSECHPICIYSLYENIFAKYKHASIWADLTKMNARASFDQSTQLILVLAISISIKLALFVPSCMTCWCHMIQRGDKNTQGSQRVISESKWKQKSHIYKIITHCKNSTNHNPRVLQDPPRKSRVHWKVLPPWGRTYWGLKRYPGSGNAKTRTWKGSWALNKVPPLVKHLKNWGVFKDFKRDIFKIKIYEYLKQKRKKKKENKWWCDDIQSYRICFNANYLFKISLRDYWSQPHQKCITSTQWITV